jgi:hypothetical protein
MSGISPVGQVARVQYLYEGADMSVINRVLIAGAGPVGLVAAAKLVRSGVPVTVFEAGHNLSEESRTSTFHPPTLDMLHELGAARQKATLQNHLPLGGRPLPRPGYAV